MPDTDADLTVQQTPEELGIPPDPPAAAPPLPSLFPNMGAIVPPPGGNWPGGGRIAPADAQDAASGEDYDLKRLVPMIEQQQELNRQALDAYRQQLSRPPPPIPQPRQMPAPPKPGIDPQAASQWLAAAGVMGAISGLGSRRGAMAGLNAFTGTLNGLRQGNQQQYENSVKEWNQQQQQFAQNAKQEWDQYQAIVERNDLTSRQAAQMVELQALQNKNQFMAEVARAAVKRGDLGLIATTLDTSGKTLAQYFQSSHDLAQQHKDRLEEIAAQGANQVKAAEVRAGLGMETPEALMQRVDDALVGNMRVATQGLRAGTQNEAAFRNLLATEATKRGFTPEMRNKMMQDYAGQLTEAQSLGRYGARAGTATAEVAQAIKPVLDASDAVPRGKWVPINELMNNWRKYTSDPAYNNLITQMTALRNAYIRAMNPTSNATEGARRELQIQDLINASTSPEALEVQLRAIMLETQNMERGVAVARGQAAPPPDPFAGRPSPLTSKGTSEAGEIVIQNGWRYQRQPDGSMKAIGRVQ